MRKGQAILLVVTLAALLLSTAQAFKFMEQLKKHEPQGFEVRETRYGWHQAVRDSEDLIEHILYGGDLDIGDIMNTPSLYEGFLTRMNEHRARGIEATTSILNCSVGNEKNFFKFAAWPAGVIGKGLPKTQTINLDTLPDDCWTNIQVDFTLTGDQSYELSITPSGLKDTTFKSCSSYYTIGTTRQMNSPMNVRKPIKLTYTDLGAEKIKAVDNFGLHFYRTCDSTAHIIPDIWMTVLLFLGGTGLDPTNPFWGSKPAPWQNTLNPAFIEAGNGYKWRPREPATFVDLDETQVHSGDFLIVTRMDGVDQLIQWGAGSIAGHSVMLLEIDGELNVVESQDGWYWPKHGIQRNTWKQWKEWALNADFSVAVLPLSDEMRKVWDNDAAVKFFKELEGYPYGYHNFLFGWIDKPDENIPPVTTLEFLYLIFSQLEKVVPAVIKTFVGEALNLRLGTKDLNMFEIYNTITDRGMTLQELFAIPEKQEWIYSDGPSYVCSAFVAGVYKAAGLFQGKTIQAQEFTPRDVYQMNFYNTTGIRPAACKIADPDLPYCQIMGKFKMDITKDGWSTKQPYDNMFERCPSMPPLYSRPDDC